MVKRIVILLCLLYLIIPSSAQINSPDTGRINQKRFLIVAGANVAFYTASFIALNKAWYAEYDRTHFHFFNDNPEWNQMDKAGHVWSTYHISRLSAEMWQWTNMSREKSAVAGALSGMVYQSIIELQDAYSAKWGFSWGDVASNVAGAGIFLAQDLSWNEQRVQVKMGYHQPEYPADLLHRRSQLFGKSTAERILKDYNAQTYWVTANLSSFFKDAGIPAWLNLAVGYSAEGMYGGRNNYWTDNEGRNYDYTDIKRLRKFYLGPDIDLTRIPVKSKVVRTVFFILNSVKIPLPAMELRDRKLKVVIR